LGHTAAAALAAGGAAALAPPQAVSAPERPPAADTALAPELPVRELTLTNGMRFLILPRPGSPTISFVVQYAVGGADEARGRTGLVHLLEHMLFKGTTSVGTRDAEAEARLLARIDDVADSLTTLLDASIRAGPAPETADTLDERGQTIEALQARIDVLEDSARVLVVSNEFDRMLARNGARNLNATTSSESTIYYVELPANRAELWFVLEADRMANPVFREFYAERDVVMEERRMRVDTNPSGLLHEAYLATAFQVHPYGQPVVGYMADLERLTRRDVLDYYRRYYGPHNAIVAIVGDLDADRIERWAESYFGGLPRGEPPPPVRAVEPAQTGLRRVEVVSDAEPSLRLGWHVPAASHPDSPALVMLSSLLTGGRTSRLYQRLVVEERLATFVSASLGPGERYPRHFTIAATPRAPHDAAELEAAIVAELAALASDGPEARELMRVRNQVDAGQVRRLQSNLGLAFQLAGSASLHGDWRETFRASARIGEVTAEQVTDVLRRYLRPSNRTVAVLVRPDQDTADDDAPARGGGGR
jgi:predicted Zn-dependent peptidase